MQIMNNIKTFLYDLNYFVNVYENHVHIYNYNDLVKLSEIEIILLVEDFYLHIKGFNMHITKMVEKELLIEGTIHNMEFKRWKIS